MPCRLFVTNKKASAVNKALEAFQIGLHVGGTEGSIKHFAEHNRGNEALVRVVDLTQHLSVRGESSNEDICVEKILTIYPDQPVHILPGLLRSSIEPRLH